MGIQVNIGDHVCPHAGWVSIPLNHYGMVNWARNRAKLVARRMPSANRYFSRLPQGRTLTSLLEDRTIWINYNPATGSYGQTSLLHPTEIAFGHTSFRRGRWTVLATLIHELAHVGGAPGGEDPRAEQTLLHCGLGRWSELHGDLDDPRTPFNPWIHG
jgi:hypothetical protein